MSYILAWVNSQLFNIEQTIITLPAGHLGGDFLNRQWSQNAEKLIHIIFWQFSKYHINPFWR